MNPRIVSRAAMAAAPLPRDAASCCCGVGAVVLANAAFRPVVVVPTARGTGFGVRIAGATAGRLASAVSGFPVFKRDSI